MNIQENVDLKAYSTMRLGGQARYLLEVDSEKNLEEAISWAERHEVPYLMIGEGSNIVWRDEGFSGLILVNKFKGKKVVSDNADGAILHVGAGEDWDEVVAWSVDMGLGGIEFLSAIPGMAGAAPVQNIGAYGAELSDVLVEVEAYDTQEKSFGGILAEACNFSYRNSRFKSIDRGRFLITGLSFRLNRRPPQPAFYESLQKYLTDKKITDYTPQTIRDAVIAIRKIRLPDPSVVANNGSFFTNPFVSEAEFKQLQAKFPEIKGWPAEHGRVKLAAGWLVEKAGFKEVHDGQTGMATWAGNALVLVNEHAQKTSDLLAFKQKILGSVKEMFNVSLEQEPELLP